LFPPLPHARELKVVSFGGWLKELQTSPVSWLGGVLLASFPQRSAAVDGELTFRASATLSV